MLLTDGGELECYDEALEVDSWTEWEHAIDEEMKSLISNQTWDLVLLPDGRKTLNNKWVFRLKDENYGTKRYKVRLVVKGCQQRK